MFRRFRPALLVIGFALAVGSLVGARALTAGHGNDAPKSVNPAGTGKAGGPVVLGTVDSDPEPIRHGLPPVLPSGTVAEVFVRSGTEVKAGDKLYAFDTRLQREDLAKAEAAVEVARAKVVEAQEGAKQHAAKVKVLEQDVAVAENKEKMQAALYKVVKGNLETQYKASKTPKEDWEGLMAIDPGLYKANVDWLAASQEVEVKKAALAALKAADPQVNVKQAEAGVRLAQAEVAKAQAVIDLCTVTAQVAGTVERVTISPGSTLGVSTRDPALWLIPSGPRIVRAEVEADFAHRVGDDLKGKEVVVYDNSDPKLTYKGTVRRIGGTFLAKRTGGDGMFNSDTRALEVEVEVPAAPPPGQPPLRVGQRVRVALGS
jgi:multidrug resistance efflux pump